MQKSCGSLFQFCGDGHWDALEQEAVFIFVDEWTGGGDIKRTEFELSGLNAEELGYMYVDERRKVLEKAGLNPNDYDF